MYSSSAGKLQRCDLIMNFPWWTLGDLNPQYVQIRVRCCKCGKLGLTSAELEWSPVFWDAVYLEV